MSAITGIYHFNQTSIPIEQGMELMKAFQKFPANYVSTWYRDFVFLGCHAQCITPESVDERLPYYDSERKLAITADAIIDNRHELFSLLQVEHARRRNMSDSELILLAYRKWGEDAPKYLVGEFAFMIWDEVKNQLFGARDFSGSRTLYYYGNDERFAFSTLIQPLFTLPNIEKKLNEHWLAEFLAVPGMNEAVDTSITVFTNIEQVPPSHSITVSEGRVKLSRYVILKVGEPLQLKSNHEYEEAFREVFQSAVTARLRTHRNVGAHLSGGLDSGTVVSFAARALQNENKRLHSFSYVPAKDFIDWTPKYLVANERPYIESTVQYVGNITDHYGDFAGTSPLSEITDWLETMEMPYKFFANSNWIKGIFEKANEQDIGVLLNGGRGNLSISWGSALSYYAILLKKLKWVRLYQELNQYSRHRGGDRLRMLPVIGKLAFPRLSQAFSPDEPHPFPMLINPEMARRTQVFDKLKDHGIHVTGAAREKNIYSARKRHFEEVYPWNATGTLGTKLSLRYSLWKRDPTNDIRVIRFCLSVPEGQYVQNGLDRALVRRSTKNLLPDNVRLNQSIRGVQGADCVHRMTPEWGSFIAELEQLSSDPIVAELINMPVLKAAISKIKAGPQHEYSFDPDYQLSMFSLILYRFIKKI
ncbi:lasso peptide isopeptide bond-forming cyclase [Paenibacillus sp. LMG 31456]|uniref:asparagine synthase (glutamine-hydrolyzing) n=1 Tax=Paenibacillus foliorum TaxID=2654974 RepID=A0A972H0T3_9BACL|nr:lasso peptide isopeptide bond-forming cyclase [Paenibacillus foliorum]NOU97352.1 lasso peptide isopeptide bond-forming cyclase [Paenibacillus foliorum]